MKTESEIRKRLEEFAEEWRETRSHPTREFQPYLQAVVETLEWVLDEEEEEDD